MYYTPYKKINEETGKIIVLAEKCKTCNMCALVEKTFTGHPIVYQDQYYQCISDIGGECVDGINGGCYVDLEKVDDRVPSLGSQLCEIESCGQYTVEYTTCDSCETIYCAEHLGDSNECPICHKEHTIEDNF